MCLYMCVCICVCMYVCMYVCTISNFSRASQGTGSPQATQTHVVDFPTTYIYIHPYTHTRLVHTYIQTHIHTYIHIARLTCLLIHKLSLAFAVHGLGHPSVLNEVDKVLITELQGLASPRAIESAACLVCASEGVCSTQRNDLLVIHPHAIEHVTQMLRTLTGVRQTSIGYSLISPRDEQHRARVAVRYR
jgi:hypothetical protein